MSTYHHLRDDNAKKDMDAEVLKGPESAEIPQSSSTPIPRKSSQASLQAKMKDLQLFFEADVRHQQNAWLTGFMRRLTRKSSPKHGDGKPFWPVVALSLVLGIFSCVPYNLLLAADPGSPLFISFVLHIVIVASYVPRAAHLLRARKLPAGYHLAFAVLGFLFSALKSDAFERLPRSTCAIVANIQMLVGVVIQRSLFGKRHSWSQLIGVCLVTLGVTWAGGETHKQATNSADKRVDPIDFGVGTAEMIGALVALTFLNIAVKKSFSHYGEAVEEQIFVQHLLCLPMFFFGGQWQSRIAPRIFALAEISDAWLAFLLVVNVLATFGDRAASVQLTGRAPNLLVGHLVQTLKKFLNLFIAVLLSVPPWPEAGFWVGSIVLLLGTLQFLSASDAVQVEVQGKDDDQSTNGVVKEDRKSR